MIELNEITNESLTCNICFNQINNNKKNECSRCNYIMCSKCFSKYTIEYNNNKCAQCRIQINIIVPNNSNYIDITYRLIALEEYIYCLLPLILIAYIIGSMKYQFKALMGILIISFLFFILYIVNIYYYIKYYF